MPRSQLPGKICFPRMMWVEPSRSPHLEIRSQAKKRGVAIIRLHELRAQRLVGGSAHKEPSLRIAVAQISLPEPPDGQPKDMQSLHPRQQRNNRAFALGKSDDLKIQNRGSGSPRAQY